MSCLSQSGISPLNPQNFSVLSPFRQLMANYLPSCISALYDIMLASMLSLLPTLSSPGLSCRRQLVIMCLLYECKRITKCIFKTLEFYGHMNIALFSHLFFIFYLFIWRDVVCILFERIVIILYSQDHRFYFFFLLKNFKLGFIFKDLSCFLCSGSPMGPFEEGADRWAWWIGHWGGCQRLWGSHFLD